MIELTASSGRDVVGEPQGTVVLTEDRGRELDDSMVAGIVGQSAQQPFAEAVALPGVLDQYGHLGGAAVVGDVVANDADDVLAELGDDRLAALVIDLGEVMQQLLRRSSHGLEEPQVHGFRRQPEEQAPQAIDVVDADGTERHCLALDDHGLGEVIHGPLNAVVWPCSSREERGVGHRGKRHLRRFSGWCHRCESMEMPSFAVRYRSRGEERVVRWVDGVLTAEPLIEVLVDMLIRSRHEVRGDAETEAFTATLETPKLAALTVLEALHEVGAHIVRWEGAPPDTDDGGPPQSS